MRDGGLAPDALSGSQSAGVLARIRVSSTRASQPETKAVCQNGRLRLRYPTSVSLPSGDPSPPFSPPAARAIDRQRRRGRPSTHPLQRRRAGMLRQPGHRSHDAIIGEMVQALVEEADPEQVILFGSRARGDSRERSDVDLIVVEAEPFGPERSRHKEMVRLRQALRPFRVPVDVLVYSQEEVDYWRDSLNYVLARALREGRVMYERSQVRTRPAGGARPRHPDSEIGAISRRRPPPPRPTPR